MSAWLRRSDRSFLGGTFFSGIQIFTSKHLKKKKSGGGRDGGEIGTSSVAQAVVVAPQRSCEIRVTMYTHTTGISALEFSSKPCFFLSVPFLRGKVT